MKKNLDNTNYIRDVYGGPAIWDGSMHDLDIMKLSLNIIYSKETIIIQRIISKVARYFDSRINRGCSMGIYNILIM